MAEEIIEKSTGGQDNDTERGQDKDKKDEQFASALSVRLPNGGLAEAVFDPNSAETAFAVHRDGSVTTERRIVTPERTFLPYAADNTLIAHGVILLPSRAAEYESEAVLVREIQQFLHKYVDVNPVFERIASYYVLLTWLYDSFHELPYLRVQGDPGSGKTRFLLTVGSLCHRPIFASGASTVSPIFRLLDACRGTLVIDESDFEAGDERADMVKILNQGHSRGFAVLRTESDGKYGELRPRAYQVFGPKIIATRGPFGDTALETRCLTEILGGRRLREDIPINLTERRAEEALALRNKLLMFRFRHSGKPIDVSWVDRRLEPRLNQIFAPLMAVIDSPDVRGELQELAYAYQVQLVSDRGMEPEAQLLEVLQELSASGAEELGVKNIAASFTKRFQSEYDRRITARWVGHMLRHRLGLRTERRQGRYVISSFDTPKLARLYERYGLAPPDTPAV